MFDANDHHRSCSGASPLSEKSITRSIRSRFETQYTGTHGNYEKHCGRLDTCFGHRHQSQASDHAAKMERVLSSFYTAVAQEFGSEQAAKAASDWIEELQKSCVEGRVDWRSVTIAAARRLAHRVNSPARY